MIYLVFLACLSLAALSYGCSITQGPKGTAPVYKCPDCAYIVQINLRAGCWIDAVTSFRCNDGTTVTVGKGNLNGGAASSATSVSGFVSASIGSASGNNQLWGAAALKLTSDTKVSTPEYGYQSGCYAGTTPVSYTSNRVTTVAGKGSKLVGIQVQAGGPYGSVTSVQFLAGTVKDGLSLGMVGLIPGGISNFLVTNKGYNLRFTSKDTSITATVAQNMVKCFFSSYLAQIARFNKAAARNVIIIVDPAYDGVAGTANDVITVSANYINHHPLDYGLIAHEGMHVVQAYSKASPEETGFWVEGLADYARNKYGCQNAQAGWAFSDPTPNNYFTDAYGVTARFLTWLEARVNASIPNRLDTVLRAGTYTSQFWVTLTGRTVETLWKEYMSNPALP